MMNVDYEKIAKIISSTKWKEQSKVTEENYTIERFKSTAFDSDYKCYKVTKKQWIPNKHSFLEGRTMICELVVKISTISEMKVLNVLFQLKFNVPKVYEFYKNRVNDEIVMIFESFVKGNELYGLKNVNIWIKTVQSLSKIHLYFWNDAIDACANCWPNLNEDEMHFLIKKFQNKINAAFENVKYNHLWLKLMMIIKKRSIIAPKTLIHGDMFPTNVLVNYDDIYFIDWENAGELPYFMDIARLTGLLDSDGNDICPCKDLIIEAYYIEIKDKLRLDSDNYKKDVYMGQFIELAFLYTPKSSHLFDKAVEIKLDELAKLILQ